MDIGGWLRRLGLERYETAFRDNEIDWAVLPKLTSDDLKEIGVTAVGHRRKLLDAIATLGAAAATATVTAAVSDVSAATEAERRQLTVMFCDLVGSTPLSTRFDPEDLREIVGAYHRCVTDTVGRFGGFVAKYMGDGVLIYFGYPEAHEDDAERAARAGLAVIDAVGRLATQEPLNVRIGIASGLVVVGDLIGAGAAQERGVVGETPNLAARLQALARPGTLVVADSTKRQIGTLFEIEDLGPQPLAGFAEPQPAWRVVGESEVVSRFEALRSGTTPLVGRDEELDLLLRRWQQAKSGAGRVVLVSGEPGIGKSRLTAALSQRIETKPHTRLRYFCSPHDQDSALFPFIAQLERAAGFARGDTTATRLDKLEALLSDAEPGEISLIAEMLLLSGGERFAPLDLSPQRKKERTLAALLRQLQALARRQPVLMIFEDLHWIDPTSREVLDLTVEKITELPVLLVATYRPEFQPPWVGQSQVTVIALNRLGRNEGATLVHRLAGNLGALPPDVVDEIVERTDGVPLFVEELTKAVVEAGADRGHASISAVPPPLQPPCTPRCWAASTGSAPRPRLWHRSAPPSGAIFPMSCWRRPRRSPSPNCRRPSAASSKPASSSSAARRRRPNICSSTRWSRTPPTAHCCAARARPCIAGSPRRWSSGFRTSSKPGRRSSRTTTAKPPSPTRRSAIGTSRANRRSPNRPCMRRSRNYAEASACWTGYAKLASANSWSSVSTSP